jgi:dTMP kinase
MAARGKLIVFEGIDGSGKRTQLELLAQSLLKRGVPFTQVGFPRYDGFFGKLVGQFLNGEFGPLEAVDPHFSALLYAGDRFESKQGMESSLAAGKAVLSDRYIGSNLAHQGARVPAAIRAEFLEWLARMEYEIYGLPREDLVLYLRLPVTEAHRLIGEKEQREYTTLRRDLQEADTSHLAAAAAVYGELARQPNWVTIECMDSTRRALRLPEEIHKDILAAVEARVFSPARAKG